VSLLCEETAWPLPDGFVDKLILLHGLETSEHPAAVLEESLRVLRPGGRALFIVPNRSGLWARRDGTPFGFGRPYSSGQLEAQLRQHGFEPEAHRAALFSPPTSRRFWLKTASIWENAGQRMSAYYAGGVLMVEATKRVYRPTGLPTKDGLPRPLRILDALPQPGAEPA
ncbi:class I SAM-dependent methyltransferase, partial [Rhodovulum sulfidophilum]|nr:class I SAM-dependent methyltransferase [Rhodovulum sulfidophilum]